MGRDDAAKRRGVPDGAPAPCEHPSPAGTASGRGTSPRRFSHDHPAGPRGAIGGLPAPLRPQPAAVQLAITSIQRNRAPYLLEWIAFHQVVGVQRFYLYLHNCTDGSVELVQRLAGHAPLVAHVVDSDTPAQLPAYRHAWERYGGEVDWMAFLDGDEFLMPTRAATLPEAIGPLAAQPVSALAAYWVCYGSSGHLDEPGGLMMERFTRHAGPDFSANAHVKSLLRGGEPGVGIHNAHWFETPRGTIDDRLRPVQRGYQHGVEPSYDALRINHYVTQSYGYFKQTKQRSGLADVDLHAERPDAWFDAHDRNDCDDGIRWRFLLALKRRVRELQQAAGIPDTPPQPR